MAQQLDLSKFQTTPKLDTSKFDSGQPEPDIDTSIPDYGTDEENAPEAPAPDEGWFHKAYRMASQPLVDAPSRFARSVSEYINPERTTQGVRGIGSAYLEALGEGVSGLTSPINLALMGGGLATKTAAELGAPTAAKMLNYATRGASAPIAGHGAYQAATGKTWDERVLGAVEAVMGGMGMRSHLPTPATAAAEHPILRGPEFEDPGGMDWVNQELAKLREGKYNQEERPAGPWDTNAPAVEIPKKTGDQLLFDLARERHGMATDMPESEISRSGPIDESKYSIPDVTQPITEGNIFKKMQAEGMFGGDRTTGDFEPPPGSLADTIPNFRERMNVPEYGNDMVDELDTLQHIGKPESRAEGSRFPAAEADFDPSTLKFGDQLKASLAERAKPPAEEIPKLDVDKFESEEVPRVFEAREPPESTKASEMRVPGINPKTGNENIAVGGADPRVLEALGTALYTRDRPATVVKELLQNSVDELKISGKAGPIRVGFSHSTVNPGTGAKSRSISMKDFGRGMTSDQLYTIFTDVGKTGKEGEAGASGGFGFAKAAPLLGGDYVKIESVVNESGKRLKHTFEGNPAELKNQKAGVPLKTEEVGKDTPTGFKAEVFFPQDKYLHGATKLLKQTAEGTPGLTGVESFEDYDNSGEYMKHFLDTGTQHPNSISSVEKFEGQAIPPKKAEISSSGADMDLHYELDNKERKGGQLVILNNGLYFDTENIGYGMHPAPHLPEKIVVNIKPTVEDVAEGYPFGLNREKLSYEVKDKIESWISDNLVKSAENKRIEELQKVFDDLKPAPGNKHVILDSGNRYTPEELTKLETSPNFNIVANIMRDTLRELDRLINPTGKTEKFGFHIGDEGAGGINIPTPRVPNRYAVLVNPFSAILKSDTPIEASNRMLHIMLHEFTHNTARSEGSSFTWELANTYTKFDLEKQLDAARKILRSITESGGNYDPKVQELLSEYKKSRGRSETTPDLLGRERESEYSRSPRQEGISSGNQPNGKGATRPVRSKFLTEDQLDPNIPVQNRKSSPKAPPSKLAEIWNLPRSMQSIDLPGITSAALRQSRPLAFTRDWFKGWVEAAKSFGSADALKAIQEDIRSSKYFEPRYEPIINKNGDIVKYSERPSIAEEMGVKMTDFVNDREEAIISSLAEKIPLYGRYVKASNRAYTGFLNSLRKAKFEQLMDAAKAGGEGNNVALGKDIADFVNNATGRGSLKYLGGKINLETSGAAKVLGNSMYSPRALSARLAFMNPANYTKAAPMVRNEYWKGLARIGVSWGAASGLASMMPDTYVSMDPNNADFGKIRIGNTRFDPGAGFQQLLVLANRELPRKLGGGGITSSSGRPGVPGHFTPFGVGFKPETRLSTVGKYAYNQLHPSLRFIFDMLSSTRKEPFDLTDRSLQMVLPMYATDIADAAKDDNYVAAFFAPLLSSMGAGVQSYGKNDFNKPKITPFVKSMTGVELPTAQIGR